MSDAKLTVDKLTLDKYKSASVEDKFYDVPLHPVEGLPSSPNLKVPFSSKSLSFDEFSAILATRRNASCPGLNAIPYKVYKQCTQIRKFLFNIFCSCLKDSVVPLQWRNAMEHYIPKTKPPCPSNIKDFRPIILLKVEGKLFFSLISKRLVKHIITKHNLINTSVQKGCMGKVPGCWQLMPMMWSALKETQSTKSSLANIWLDIANAYGSIPHRLLFFALERYGVDPHWISLIKIYYSGIYSRSFSQSAPSSWHQHFKGIFAGCTLSIILFLAGINVVIEYTLASSARKFVSTGNVAFPLQHLWMI